MHGRCTQFLCWEDSWNAQSWPNEASDQCAPGQSRGQFFHWIIAKVYWESLKTLICCFRSICLRYAQHTRRSMEWNWQTTCRQRTRKMSVPCSRRLLSNSHQGVLAKSQGGRQGLEFLSYCAPQTLTELSYPLQGTGQQTIQEQRWREGAEEGVKGQRDGDWCQELQCWGWRGETAWSHEGTGHRRSYSHRDHHHQKQRTETGTQKEVQGKVQKGQPHSGFRGKQTEGHFILQIRESYYRSNSWMTSIPGFEKRSSAVFDWKSWGGCILCGSSVDLLSLLRFIIFRTFVALLSPLNCSVCMLTFPNLTFCFPTHKIKSLNSLYEELKMSV